MRLALVVLVVASVAVAQVPPKLGYQGRLVNADGTPAAGIVDTTFAVYDAPTGGNALWTEPQHLGLTDGYYATFLGDAVPLPLGLFDGSERYLELDIGGIALTPRQRVGSVPYALVATSARNVTGGAVSASSVSIGGQTVLDGNGKLAGPAAYAAGAGIAIDDASRAIAIASVGCAAGQPLTYTGSGWACATVVPAAGSVGNAMLANSGVTIATPSGSGLTGGGAVALGATLTLANAGVLSLDATSPLQSTGGQAPTLSLGTVGPANGGTGITSGPSAATQFLRATTGGNAWTIGTIAASDLPTPGGDVGGTFRALNVQALQGIPLPAATPANGDVLKYDATNGKWTTSPDLNSGGTVTSVSATAPLSVSNPTTTPALTLGTVPTSLGGTGLTTAPTAAGQVLRASGSGAWAIASLGAADLAAGGTAAISISGNAATANAFTGALAGDVTGAQGATSISALQGKAVSTTGLVGGDVLAFDGTQWSPQVGGVSVTAGAGLSGGGPVALGGTVALANTGVLSLASGGGVNVSASSGAVSLSTVAGGDLSGSLANATVAKLASVPLARVPPADGQILKFHPSTGWTPDADLVNAGTVTSVSASAPLVVANGATTPAISLGTVGIANGGTGITSGPASNQFLRDNGSGAWVAGGITSADVPSLSARYVDLSSAQTIGGVKTFSSPIAGSVTGSAASFTGNLAGDVTGAQGATAIASLQGKAVSTTGLAAGNVLRFGGTSWAPSTDVASVAAGAGISVSAASGAVAIANTGVLSVSATGPLSATLGATPTLSLTQASASAPGYLSAADWSTFNTGAGLASGATSADTAGALVKRDASGNFSAGVVTASLTGAASLNVLRTGDTMTGALNLPAAGLAVGTSQLVVASGGAVGVGTASPAAGYSLDVNGRARAVNGIAVGTGAGDLVSAGTWETLTGGATSNADNLHTHTGLTHPWQQIGGLSQIFRFRSGSGLTLYDPLKWEFGMTYNNNDPLPLILSGWDSGTRAMFLNAYMTGDSSFQPGGWFGVVNDVYFSASTSCGTTAAGDQLWWMGYWYGWAASTGGNGCGADPTLYVRLR